MTIDETLLEQIREASRDLWRDVGLGSVSAWTTWHWRPVSGLSRWRGSSEAAGGTDLLLNPVAGAGSPLLLISILSAGLAIAFLSQDAKTLIGLAATGVGREGLIRGLEDQVRGRAAGVIRRLRAAVILLFAVVLSIPQLAAWLFR